jgi:hypothetical protein
MKPLTTPDAEPATLVITTPLEETGTADSRHDIRLDSCCDLEWIVVRTRNSTYELIVLSGDTGEVMVRGGEFFKDFIRANFIGSILGASAIKVRTICTGCHLEFYCDGKRFVTSRVEHASRYRVPVAEGAA